MFNNRAYARELSCAHGFAQRLILPAVDLLLSFQRASCAVKRGSNVAVFENRFHNYFWPRGILLKGIGRYRKFGSLLG